MIELVKNVWNSHCIQTAFHVAAGLARKGAGWRAAVGPGALMGCSLPLPYLGEVRAAPGLPRRELPGEGRLGGHLGAACLGERPANHSSANE